MTQPGIFREDCKGDSNGRGAEHGVVCSASGWLTGTGASCQGEELSRWHSEGMVGEGSRSVGRHGWELLCGPESGQPASGSIAVRPCHWVTSQAAQKLL